MTYEISPFWIIFMLLLSNTIHAQRESNILHRCIKSFLSESPACFVVCHACSAWTVNFLKHTVKAYCIWFIFFIVRYNRKKEEEMYQLLIRFSLYPLHRGKGFWTLKESATCFGGWVIAVFIPASAEWLSLRGFRQPWPLVFLTTVSTMMHNDSHIPRPHKPPSAKKTLIQSCRFYLILNFKRSERKSMSVKSITHFCAGKLSITLIMTNNFKQKKVLSINRT